MNCYKDNFPPEEKSHTSKTQSLVNKWSQTCQAAFDTVVQKLTSAPVLGFADWKIPYILHTDASVNGLGAALYQVQDGKTRVIAYASRGLSRSEKNYPVHKLEFLALKWAICEKFHDYLYGVSFQVLTDNNPLTYVLTTAKLDAAGHRWLAALSLYNFDIKYRAGKTNIDADGLSRIPHECLPDDEESEDLDRRVGQLMDRASHSPEDFKMLSQDVKNIVCLRHQVASKATRSTDDTGDDHSSDDEEDGYIPLVETLLCDENAVPDSLEEPDPWPGSSTLPGLRAADWQRFQREDATIKRVIDLMESGTTLSSTEKRHESRDVCLLWKERPRLIFIDKVLYRQVSNQVGQCHYQLVIPESHREMALEGVHDQTGHMGYERTLELARARFYWPKIAAAVEQKCKTCERCLRRKARAQRAAKLVNIKVYSPLELVCIDFLSLEPDSGDIRNVLVITDHFTKYAMAFPTKDQTAKTVATIMWENLICNFGFPKRVHSDQGANFESEIVAELCKLAGVKSRTTPYHPRGNPVERFNRTLLDLLGTLEDKKKEHWRKYVRPVVHAYNCTRNDATGESPFFLMFGRQPRLPIDLCFGICPAGYDPKTHTHYVSDLKKKLKYAYKLATESAEKRQLLNKRRWDSKVTAAAIDVGDRVLVRNVNIRKKHKIADRWESTVYVVTKQPNTDIPVYVVTPEDGDGRERVLHRDLLLPCGFLPVKHIVHEEQASTRVDKPCTRSRVREGSTQSKEDSCWQEVLLNPEAPEFQMPGKETREDSLLVEEGDLSFLNEGEEISFQVEGETCDEEQIPVCPHACSEEICTGATVESTSVLESGKNPASLPTCDSETCDKVEETSQMQGNAEASAMPQRPKRERCPPV